jgi:fluoroquinolone transport system ATP-binding protein
MIEVRDLSFAYPSSTGDTLQHLSFEIASGEIFGFLGPSGSGKSTTQRLLIGLLKNYRGEVKVLDRDLRQWGRSYYNRIGVGFELPNHFAKLSGEENLELFASFYAGSDGQTGPAKKKIAELLSMVELTDAARMPVSQYSKGMKMRLNFARALLNDPQLVFLDEPTAGLDPVTARRLKNIILDLKRQGKTIFLTTHNMHDADELCDRIAFIVEGQIKLIGVPRDLRVQNGKPQVTVRYRTAEGDRVHEQQFPLNALGSDSGFLNLINTMEVESIHSQEATLEDVFINVTGRQLV